MKRLIVLFLVASFIIASQDISIRAERFEVNLENNYFQAHENIVIEYGELVIEADIANYKESKNIINLFDNIEAVYSNVTIHCQRMVFNRVDNIINASRDVKVIYNDYKIFADTLIYYPGEGRMLFYGETTIYHHNNVLKSKDIIIDMEENKIYSEKQTSFVISGKE